MTRLLRKLTLAVMVGPLAAAAAETRFVTDEVLAEFYAEPRGGEVLGRLPTGSRVEVLEKADGFARIRLPGGDEGWMRTRWLSEREPAQAALLRLADDHERARRELAELRRQRPPRHPLDPLEELPLWTLGAIAGGGLLVGFVAGAGWLDRRYRDRHGGFRL